MVWTMKSKRTPFFEYQAFLALAFTVSACGSGQFLVAMDSTMLPDATAPDGATESTDGASEASSDAEPGDAGEASAPASDGAVDATLADAGTAGDASDGGPDARADADAGSDAGAAIDAQVCDPTKSPHDDPCVLSTAYGVFVSPGGADTNPGTAAAPKRTIAAAVALAIADNRARVYLCDGVYPEAIDIHSPVSFYGGLGCPSGDAGALYLTGTLAQILPAINQPALTIDGVDASVAVEDLALTSVNASGQDDAGNGSSSVAAVVNGSTVAFRRCTFLAGSGERGSDGTTPSNYVGATAPDGLLNDGGAGGAGGSITCADGTRSFGGMGSPRSLFGPSGDGGAVPMPMTTPGVDGRGGMGGLLEMCLLPVADVGANGAAASVAAVAAGTIGTLGATSWRPTSGGGGNNGSPGQGGGAGGLTEIAPGVVLGGIGGGAGGCGGAGGTGGGGGGGSIALLCAGSHVDIAGCSFVSGAGGNGGNGAAGQRGQGGGSSPDAAAALPCNGGAAGGNGGGGAGGAGGAGGISVCVLFSGTTPSGGASCITGAAGVPGAGGVGGAGGTNASGTASSGASSPAGVPGIVQVELVAP
jgi:hypothetical protein